MINGFKKETKPLTKKEREILKPFIYMTLLETDKCNKITSKEIDQRIFLTFGKKIGGARIRKIINNIRINEQLFSIIATNQGYFITKDCLKVRKYIDGLVKRAEAILSVANAEIEIYNKFSKEKFKKVKTISC